jgi:hypothetical protein
VIEGRNIRTTENSSYVTTTTQVNIKRPINNNKFDLNNEPLHTIEHTVNNIYCDRDYLMEEDIDTSNNINKYNINCPEISIKIFNCEVNALFDSGSTISCISEQWLNENIKSLGKFEQLPLTNTVIKTATGTKSKRINRLLYMPINICGHIVMTQLLLIPNLIKPIILGCDTMERLQVNINFATNEIRLIINNQNVVREFDRVYQDGITCFITNNMNNEDEYCDINVIGENKSPDNNNNKHLSDQEIISMIKENQYLEDTQQEDLITLLLQYKHIFSETPGLCQVYEHELKVTDHKSFKQMSYPVPLAYQDAVLQEINRMENLGIIERSKSNYINPIIPVIKKTGEIRLCLDARKINEIIIPDFECNQSVNEILMKCSNAKYISGIDLTASYWQIPLSSDSRQYTAFQFKGRTYHYRVTPFGISTSQAALVRALDQVFEDKISEFTAIYVDDICVISNNFENHLKHLQHIFQKISDANMTINLKKSMFCQQSIPFLGYTLTSKGLEMDDSKVKPIMDFPSPKTRTHLKAFLGMINYYNKFLDKFSETIQPLMRLTSKKNKFIWTEKEEETFRKTKELFLHSNVIHHPDLTQPFYLQTDASDFSIGGHLYQVDENGKKLAVVFISRTLQPHEQRFTSTEKELLSILHCLHKTRYIILGSRLTVITDNHALTFLKTCKLLNNRLARWILAIQEYNFTIKHCKGVENITADTLSRMDNPSEPSLNHSPRELEILYIRNITDLQLRKDLQNLPELQATDSKIQSIYHILTRQPDSKEAKQISSKYKLFHNIIYKKHKEEWLIIIPKCLTHKLVWECHNYYLHCGPKKCHQLLLENFIFKNMGRTIRQILSSCDICQHCKINPKPLTAPAHGITCREKNDQIAVDIIGPLPTSSSNVKYILIVIDIFTKFVNLYCLQRATTKTILNRLLNQHFPKFGIPNKIQTDNGTQFKSHKWIQKMEILGIEIIFNPVYYPCFNLAERPIREIKRCLRTYCHKNHKTWAKCIPEINQFLNEIYHETTGFTPNELHLGKKDTRFWEKYIPNPLRTSMPLERKLQLAFKNIEKTRKKRADKLNLKRKPTILNIGDKVLIKSHPLSKAAYGETAKLFEIYEGPFVINRIIGVSTYHVSDLENKNEYGPYHVTALKRYIESTHENQHK